MNNFNRRRGWLAPAVLTLILLLGMGGISWGATAKVAAGDSHTVFLHSDGSLWAAGANASGQLGNGSQTASKQAARVGAENGWQSVAAGANHNLALKADGTLWSWGSNASGQLGAALPNGNQAANAPVQIGTGRDWVAVAAGAASSYALKADGTLWAWGLGTSGQLGNGSSANQNQPVQVLNSGAGFVAVAAGGDHALAVKADGSLWSWGGNSFGQLGVGAAQPDPSTPSQVLIDGAISDNDWSQVAAGRGYSLALKADGSLWAWGDNASGQLGLGSTLPQNAPVQVGTAHDWSALSAGAKHVLAVKRSGTLWSWGDNGSGQLGNGLTSAQLSPVAISAPAGFSDLVSISAGSVFSLALKGNGELYAFGGNLDGQFGNGSATGSLAPVLVGNDGLGWVDGEPGNHFTVARRSNGTLWSWGDNPNGELGNGSTDPAATPTPIDSLDNWAAHSAGFGHVVALKADGTLWTWGDNSSGQLGDNSTDPSLFPIQIDVTKPASASNDWAAVAAGDFHTLALKGDGTLWAWGDNSSGQLGDNTNTPAGKQPDQIVTGNPGNFDSNWVAIAAGGSHSLGLQADGTLWAWGDNSQGQLGDPTLGASVNFPVQIINFNPPVGNLGFNSNWKAISAGFAHSLALQADGTAWSWGSNFDGQLGNADPTTPNPAGQPAPVQVANPGAAPYVSVGAGDAHSVARQADGSVWSWGRNLSGQLGIGSTDSVPTPHATPLREGGSASNWTAAVVGGSHTVALKADGTLWAWGSNFSSQLGDGTSTDRNLPGALLEAFASVPASFDLGVAFLGGNGVVKSLTVANPGNAPLFVTGATIGGTDPLLFSVTAGTCGGFPAFVVAPGGSCALSVKFQPAAPVGARSALLTFTTSDPVQPASEVALTATSAQHIITLSSGANGSIFGPTAVNENATPSYTIVPATTFHVTDVKVNGVSKGAVTALTLPPVTADLTISATFAIDTFAVNFAAGANGTLTGNAAQVVDFGSSTTTVTAVPALGHHFVNWTEGATVVGVSPALVVNNVTAAHSYTANFAIDTFAVNFASGGNGTVSGAASQLINFGSSSASVTAVPGTGYHFVNWTENGAVFATTATITVNNVTAVRSLTANFAIDTFGVTATGGARGSISPAGVSTVNYGSDLTVTFTPTTGYQVVDVVVDGVSQGSLPSYTFTNVTANGHTVEVTFIPDGDVSLDRTVTIVDALKALQMAVGLITPSTQDLLHGDVAPLDAGGIPVPDGAIGVADALVILRKAVGLTSGF